MIAFLESHQPPNEKTAKFYLQLICRFTLLRTEILNKTTCRNKLLIFSAFEQFSLSNLLLGAKFLMTASLTWS